MADEPETDNRLRDIKGRYVGRRVNVDPTADAPEALDWLAAARERGQANRARQEAQERALAVQAKQAERVEWERIMDQKVYRAAIEAGLDEEAARTMVAVTRAEGGAAPPTKADPFGFGTGAPKLSPADLEKMLQMQNPTAPKASPAPDPTKALRDAYLDRAFSGANLSPFQVPASYRRYSEPYRITTAEAYEEYGDRVVPADARRETPVPDLLRYDDQLDQRPDETEEQYIARVTAVIAYVEENTQPPQINGQRLSELLQSALRADSMLTEGAPPEQLTYQTVRQLVRNLRDQEKTRVARQQAGLTARQIWQEQFAGRPSTDGATVAIDPATAALDEATLDWLDALCGAASPLTPTGVAIVQRWLPQLTAEIRSLRAAVEEALTVWPCHDGDCLIDLSQQVPMLCTHQDDDVYRLVESLADLAPHLSRDDPTRLPRALHTNCPYCQTPPWQRWLETGSLGPPYILPGNPPDQETPQ